MTAARSIALAVLEAHAGVYYAIAKDAHATRERAVKEAAKTVEPYLRAYGEQLKRDFATNAS